MASFSVQWRNSTQKDVRRLPPHEVVRIVGAVAQLADEPFPHGSQKLSGSERTYRIRVGDYRIVYEVVNHPVVSQFEKRKGSGSGWQGV